MRVQRKLFQQPVSGAHDGSGVLFQKSPPGWRFGLGFMPKRFSRVNPCARAARQTLPDGAAWGPSAGGLTCCKPVTGPLCFVVAGRQQLPAGPVVPFSAVEGKSGSVAPSGRPPPSPAASCWLKARLLPRGVRAGIACLPGRPARGLRATAYQPLPLGPLTLHGFLPAMPKSRSCPLAVDFAHEL